MPAAGSGATIGLHAVLAILVIVRGTPGPASDMLGAMVGNAVAINL
jgi:hypothetical protein